MKVVAGTRQGSIYREYALTHEKGQGDPYKVEGIGGDKIPTSLDFDVVDEWMTVSDADSFRTARRLTREEGIFIGGSGGLNVFSALEVARRLDDPEAMVVTILCDTGERYLSKLYDDTWMRENQMMEAERVTAGQLLRPPPGGGAVPRLGRPVEQRAAGPQPPQHVGPVAGAGRGRRRLRRLGHRGPHGPGPRGRQAPRPAGGRGHGRALPGRRRGRPPRPAGLAPLEGDPGRPRAGRGRLVGIVNRYDVLREVAGIG